MHSVKFKPKLLNVCSLKKDTFCLISQSIFSVEFHKSEALGCATNVTACCVHSCTDLREGQRQSGWLRLCAIWDWWHWVRVSQCPLPRGWVGMHLPHIC